MDLSGYDWRFHHSDERGLVVLWGPYWPAENHIPVSLDLLAEAARLGRWPATYPPEGPRMRQVTRQAKRRLLLGLLGVVALLFGMFAVLPRLGV